MADSPYVRGHINTAKGSITGYVDDAGFPVMAPKKTVARNKAKKLKGNGTTTFVPPGGPIKTGAMNPWKPGMTPAQSIKMGNAGANSLGFPSWGRGAQAGTPAQLPAPVTPPASTGGAYATPAVPNYAQQSQDAMGRVNSVYDQSAQRLGLLNQQREQANAFTNQDVAASGAQRFAEMQQQLGQGYQDDSTRAAAALQLDGLRNNNQAQDEYSRRMGQMDQLDYNTALGQNSSNRAASQLGIMQDVAAQRAAAASGSGGGGGGGGGFGNGLTDSALNSRVSLINQGQPKTNSAMSMMMDRYGQLDPKKNKMLMSVRDRVLKAKGNNIEALRQLYGNKRKNLKGVMVYEHPKVMELLDAARVNRQNYHRPMGATAEDASNSFAAQNNGY